MSAEPSSPKSDSTKNVPMAEMPTESEILRKIESENNGTESKGVYHGFRGKIGSFRGRGRGANGQGREVNGRNAAVTNAAVTNEKPTYKSKVREWGQIKPVPEQPEVHDVKTDPNFDMDTIITFVNMLSINTSIEKFKAFNVFRFNDAQFGKIMECVNCFRILVDQGIGRKRNAIKLMILAARFNIALYGEFLHLICTRVTPFTNNDIIEYVKTYISKIKDDNIMKNVCSITRRELINATHVSRVCMMKILHEVIPEMLNAGIVELKNMREILVGFYKTYSEAEKTQYSGIINSLLATVEKKIKDVEK